MHFFRQRKLFKKLKYFVVLLIGLFILIRNKSNYLLNIKNDSKSFDYCQLPELNSNNNHNTSLPGKNYIYFLIILRNIINFKFSTEKECKIKKDWGYLKNNTWYYIESIRIKLNEFNCSYRVINRKDDFFYTQKNWNKLNHKHFIKDEVIEVKCEILVANFIQVIKYNSIFVQIVNKIHLVSKVENKVDQKCKPLNIMLISYDSVSRSSWLKRLPKTNKFIFETMKFELLKGLCSMFLEILHKKWGLI